jgi:hypothetical protein
VLVSLRTLKCPDWIPPTDSLSHHFRDTQGSLYYNGSTAGGLSVYAAAYIIQPSPNLPCNYYNNTANYVSASGQAYSVICGVEFTGGADITSSGNTPSKEPILPRVSATY